MRRSMSELQIRPITAGDRQALVEAFGHLSAESRYRRFLRPIKRLTSSELAYFTELDHRDHEAIVATTREGEIVGVARCIRLGERPAAAEVAVTVVDAWQGHGVGTLLLRRLAARARELGIETFVGVCLTQNREMVQLFRELGPVTTKPQSGGLVEVEIDLEAPRCVCS